eukprot:6143481-Amphidinium_carterae.2
MTVELSAVLQSKCRKHSLFRPKCPAQDSFTIATNASGGTCTCRKEAHQSNAAQASMQHKTSLDPELLQKGAHKLKERQLGTTLGACSAARHKVY